MVDGQAGAEEIHLRHAADLLGGEQVLQRRIVGQLDVHELLVHGMPVGALFSIIDRLETLQNDASFEEAIGLSLRSIRQYRGTPARPLSLEQGGRTWELALILSRAISVLGSRGEAEKWLGRPAYLLDERRPIDLFVTTPGRRMVSALLSELEYGSDM
jgi:putative toxin-antitoxin system antitoxin component (TIGR02293 family)